VSPGLNYFSRNVIRNRWYAAIAKPIKKLLREVQAPLAQVEEAIATHTRKVAPKTPRPHQGPKPGVKQPYKKLALVLD
jgi:hypothetical protein